MMQGQPQWSPYGPGMAGQGPMTVPPPPPTKSRAPALLLGLFSLVAIAGGGGYLVARIRRANSNDTPPAATGNPGVTPETAVTQPPMPSGALGSPDAAALVAAPDVQTLVEGDAPAVLAAEPDVPAVAAVAGPDAGAPVAMVAPPTPEPVVIDAGSVAPTPTPTPTPRPTPAVRNTQPRPVNVRSVPTSRSAGDAGVAVTPLTEALRRQDWATARRLLTDHLRSRPGDAAAHAQLGYVLDRLGDNPGALAQYRTATRLDRRNTRYLHRLADLQVATGDRPGAITTLQQILRINPAEPAARARLDQMQGPR